VKTAAEVIQLVAERQGASENGQKHEWQERSTVFFEHMCATARELLSQLLRAATEDLDAIREYAWEVMKEFAGDDDLCRLYNAVPQLQSDQVFSVAVCQCKLV
jgi:galactokinase/mevalonate kinase-like predicted kinase